MSIAELRSLKTKQDGLQFLENFKKKFPNANVTYYVNQLNTGNKSDNINVGFKANMESYFTTALSADKPHDMPAYGGAKRKVVRKPVAKKAPSKPKTSPAKPKRKPSKPTKK